MTSPRPQPGSPARAILIGGALVVYSILVVAAGLIDRGRKMERKAS